MKKVDAAKSLYFGNWSQKNIASVLKVTEKTVASWKKKHSWEAKRAEYALSRETAEERVLELINYQLWVLRKKKNSWIEAYEKAEDPQQLELISKGDIDALQKLFHSIKKKEESWTQYVAILREFMEYLQDQDIKLSKQLTSHVDDFLNMKRSDL